MDIVLAVLGLIASILLKPSVIVGLLVLGFLYVGSGITLFTLKGVPVQLKIALCVYLWPKVKAAVDQILIELTGKQLVFYLILGGLYFIAPDIIVWAFLIFLAFKVIVAHLSDITAALAPLFKKQ